MEEGSDVIKNKVTVEYDPFEGPEIECIIACTEPQIEILIACLLGGSDANLSFNQSITLKFTGLLDRKAMEFALQEIVMRHQSLRSAFSLKNLQLCIFKSLAIGLYYQDISLEEDLKKQQVIKDYIKNDSLHLFDLANGPLFKAGLLKLNDREHYLVLSAHHIICDGWSIGIILRELGKLYSAYVQNIMVDLPKPVLFSKFARDQVKLSKSKEYGEIEKFWLGQYTDHIPALKLATDFSRPQIRTYKSSRLDYKLDNNLIAGIKKTGAKVGCNFVSTLLAAFEIFLYRLTGQDDIIIGLPAAGQSVTGDYNLVGHCVNLLPLRSNPTPRISFLEYLEKQKAIIFDAYQYQQLTLGSLLKKIKITRDPSSAPLVPVVLNIDMGIDEGVSFYGLTYVLANNPRACDNFELFLNISGSENAFMLELSYNTQLFKRSTIALMLNGFENLLKIVIANPIIKLGDIELIEKSAILHHWEQLNKTEVEYPHTQPLHELIRQVAIKFPLKTALIFQEQEISYQILDEKANRLAHYIIRKGIKGGDFVGVVLDRSPEMLITLLAIMKTGAAYIPLDPEYPGDRISFIVEDASAKMLITSKKYDKKFSNHAGILFIETAMAESGSYAGTPPAVMVSAKDLVYLLYTSGSTGKPKGVLIEHRSLVNFLYSMREFPGFLPQDILLAVTTISFDIAGLELFLPLVTGGTIVLSTAADARDGESLIRLIEKKKVSVMQATPSTWKMMLSSGWENNSGVKILIGGEAIKEELKDALTKIAEVYNVYGPTETTIWSVCKKLEINEKVLIGKPIANTSIYIVGEQMQLVPAGVTGEICIGGDGLARGYLNRPDLTAQKFISNPFSNIPGSRIYRTGDIGRLFADGNLECLGRMDDQIKIRGYRVELGEIENTLEAIPGIKEAVVVCKEIKRDDQRLVAYIVRNDESRSKEQVDTWKKSVGLKLPAYMIPSHFEILSSLPLTPNGKIDRKALPEPRYNAKEADQIPDRPYTKNEKFIAAIWADLLSTKNVSLTDNFFELGGHSLIAIEVMNRIEKHTGKKLPLSTLFQYSTVSKLASALDDPADLHKWKSLVPIKPSGSKDPLYIIHGLGLEVMIFKDISKYMDEDQPVYGIKAKVEDGDDESLDVIEEMASFYISEIIRQNPNGPYALLGYSAGSILAFEMAKQLKAGNRQVKMLGIIDYDMDEPGRKFFFSKKVEKYTTEFIPRQLHVLKLLITHPKNAFKFQLMCLKIILSRIPARLGVDKNPEFQRAIDKFGFALKEYVATPLDINVDLFISKIQLHYFRDTKYLGWKPYALKGIKLHYVKGDHFGLILPPNCEEFARVLQNALDNAEIS